MLRPYLESSHFIVRVNHESLLWILELIKSTKRLARRRFGLVEFDFEFIHRARLYNEAAATLSRLPQKVSEKKKLNTKFDGNLPEYWIVKLISEPSRVSKVNDDEVRQLLTSEEMQDARANDVWNWSLKEVLE